MTKKYTLTITEKQAKKNGWDGPIPHGYTERKRLGKMKKSLFIHNPSDEFINDPEWGKN